VFGVKVELNASSVAETRRKFTELLTQLQDRANRTTIKIDVDLANLRQVNGILNNVISDLGRLDAQNKRTAVTMEQITKTMKTMATEQDKVNNNGKNNKGIGNFGFGNLAEWLLLRKGIQLAMTELREGITFAVDMNKAMTEISIVTGMNQTQVGQLSKEYNNLAKSMGTTTSEIAKASVEYYRQGLSTQQVNDRMKQTIQYAKVSGMALDEASTILTATVNSMDIDIKRASDVFAYLGDATATGADEIGRAFQKVGGTASALNVDFEKVSSWIATISSKTREGAETIGNSLKNMMARYQQLREKGFAEEDGTQVNQVSKSLNEVGIKIMDAQGQFRNFGTVMDELGSKWKDLDNRHKAYIATTLAGTNQQSRFLNLMENYTESVDLYKNSLDSAGTTQNKYNLYMQGTEAHLNQLKATAEGVWLKVFNSEDMRSAIDS
jgi:TP901 family phage tail tape measure protein